MYIQELKISYAWATVAQVQPKSTEAALQQQAILDQLFASFMKYNAKPAQLTLQLIKKPTLNNSEHASH